MNKAISLAMLGGGILFLELGFRASKSLSNDISRFFTVSPTVEAVWMLVIGTALCIFGMIVLLRGSMTAT